MSPLLIGSPGGGGGMARQSSEEYRLKCHVCCEDIVGMCSGNTDPNTDVDCSASSQRYVADAASTADSATCCEDIVGMCSGNTDPATDFDCSAAVQRLIATSTGTSGSTAECSLFFLAGFVTFPLDS